MFACVFFWRLASLRDEACVRQGTVLPGEQRKSSPEEEAEEYGTKDLQIKVYRQHAGLQYRSPCSCANHWQSSSFSFKVSYFSCQLCMLNTHAYVYTLRGINCSPWISFGEGALNLDFPPIKTPLHTKITTDTFKKVDKFVSEWRLFIHIKNTSNKSFYLTLMSCKITLQGANKGTKSDSKGYERKDVVWDPTANAPWHAKGWRKYTNDPATWDLLPFPIPPERQMLQRGRGLFRALPSFLSETATSWTTTMSHPSS